MKKYLFLLVMGLLILTGCENAQRNPVNNNVVSENYDSEFYEIIGLEKFKEVYANDKPTLIYFGASWCSNCVNFKEIAKQFAKENEIKVYFVQTDASDFTTEDASTLNTLVEFEYIPFITVFKNKEMLYGESGIHTLKQLEDLKEKYSINE